MLKAHKKVGQTPLELLDELRTQHPELKDEILSYAGRLDPMAEGEMLIMVGREENQKRQKFLKYDKTYEAEILFGFSTDTHDILGFIQKQSRDQINSKELKNTLKKIKKNRQIPYPVFSSKTVSGKPLFEWYRSGRISEIEIPTTKIKIKKAKLIATEIISGQDLWNYINFAVGEVRGDFRQTEILDKWHGALENIKLNSESETQFQIAKIKFKVSSGTYIRSLTEEIGKSIGVPACLLRLKRIKIHN